MPEDNSPAPPLRSVVGERISTLRRARGISLSALALRAGIGKSTLSELEAGARNPTLETLYALAGPLGVPLTGLIGDGTGRSVSDDVVRADLLTVRTHDDGAVTEVFWLTIASGGTRVSPPHAPGVVEHLRLVRGRAWVGRRDSEQQLDQGQEHSWPGDIEHTYTSREGAEGVLVIETPAGH